jgi:hypothetical protein
MLFKNFNDNICIFFFSKHEKSIIMTFKTLIIVSIENKQIFLLKI